ncbi:MAG: tol-pal system protein YbgF [Alphaproteobacteria bacterium]
MMETRVSQGCGRRWYRRWRGLLAGMAAIGSIAIATGDAAAQADMRAMLDKIERLERQITTLEQSVYRGQPPAVQAPPASPRPAAPLAPSTAADVQIRITDLENELGALTGRIEEVGHRVTQLNARLDKLVSDLDARFQEIDGKLNAPAGQPAAGRAPGAPGGQPTAALPTSSPQQLYDHAIGLLMRADKDAGYAEAERALATFIGAYPNDPRQSDARFFLGETHYVRRDYAQAAVAYAEGYRAYPNGSKAPDSLLKLGMSLGQLGKTGEACQTFAELQSKFKNPSASVAQSLSRERQRYKCR